MPSPAKQPDVAESAALYNGCNSRDPTIQATAFETLWGYLYQVAYHMLYNTVDGEALAQDCAQVALVRVYERLAECKEPAAFKSWARRIVSHLVIDELRRRKRLVPMSNEELAESTLTFSSQQPSFETSVLDTISQAELRQLINQAPISDRSRRVVLGRYLDDASDEALAQTEAQLANSDILPSHIQVTRAKNIAKLRKWDRLQKP